MEAGVIVERVAGAGDVGPHLGDGVAGVDDLDAQDVVSRLAQLPRERPQQLGARLGLGRPPGRLRGLGSRDGAVDVGGGRGRHVAECFLVGGIDRFEPFAGFSCHQLPADQHVAAHEIGMNVHWDPLGFTFMAADDPDQSALMLASWTTLAHFAISVLMRSPKCAAVSATGSKPRSCRRCFISGVATMRTISPFQRSMISCGVPIGTTTPVSVSDSWSGTPASAMVGTSGSAADRLTLSTASPRNLPSRMLAMAGGSAVKATCVWPPRVELIASAAPLNGTVAKSSPNLSLNNSPARCGVEPVPGCAKLNLPGLALTRSISSRTVPAGTSG